MKPYILTPAAERDFDEIWHYTYKKWGQNQANRYLDLLEESCSKIHRDKALWKTFDSIREGLKSLKCEHHYIFFKHNEHNIPVIIAVLHERMNWVNRLKSRLD